MPQDMRDAKMITLYKNKGDRSDCNNYRRISLLDAVRKAFASVVLNRLRFLAERVYSKAQCEFEAERSTIDMVFSLRQLQERCHKQKRLFYIAFIDLTKAFDVVSRSGPFTLLQRTGCPSKLLRIITSFHENTKGTVHYDGSSSEPFLIKSRVKQGLRSHPGTLRHLFLFAAALCFQPN